MNKPVVAVRVLRFQVCQNAPNDTRVDEARRLPKCPRTAHRAYFQVLIRRASTIHIKNPRHIHHWQARSIANADNFGRSRRKQFRRSTRYTIRNRERQSRWRPGRSWRRHFRIACSHRLYRSFNPAIQLSWCRHRPRHRRQCTIIRRPFWPYADILQALFRNAMHSQPWWPPFFHGHHLHQFFDSTFYLSPWCV